MSLVANYEDLRSMYSRPTGKVEEILYMLTLPQEAEPVRYREEGSATKSAVIQQPSEIALSWVGVTSTGTLLNSDMQVFIFRNALRNLIFYDFNNTAQTWTYSWINQDGTSTFPLIARGFDNEIEARHATPTVGYQPHGPFLFPGFDDGHNYMWVDRDAAGVGTTGNIIVTFNAAVSVVGEFVAVILLTWDGNGEVVTNSLVVTSVSVPNTSATVAVRNLGGYTRVVVTNSTTTVASCTISSSGTSPVWAHRSLGDISTWLTVVSGSRILANAALWRNVASPLNANGSVVGATVYEALPWQFLTGGYDALTALSTFRSDNAATGYYGFITPSNSDDFAFNDDINQSAFRTGGFPDGSYPLKERAPYKAIAMRVGDSLGRTTSLSLCSVFEYLSTTKTSEFKFGRHTPAEWSLAMNLIGTIPSDYENPVHWEKIVRAIGSFGQPLYDVALSIAREIPSTYGQAIAQILQRNRGVAGQVFEAAKGFKKRKGKMIES